MKSILKSISVIYFSFCMAILCGAQGSGSLEGPVAIHGYDVVSYHKAHLAVRGSVDHAVLSGGLTYYFRSKENALAFKANPDAFKPAYGGHCAFAMAAKGAKAPADPKTFKIRGGILYLFYNDLYEGRPFNTIVPWNADEKNMIKKANINWQKQ